jgi:pSer/pThr/pTyr-binding forkhead associated (FHA) protein
MPHLILVGAGARPKEVYELESHGADTEDVWEIGRQSDCDLALEDPTVSLRHAQLTQQNGRWRITNLVSSNGIRVNGEKRLSVYLEDRDFIELGNSRLLFFGASQETADEKQSVSGKTPRGSAGRVILLATIALLLAAGAYLLRA